MKMILCILIFILVFLFLINHEKFENISVITIDDYEKFENINKNYDCIISINVHEKINFLIKQLKNINDNVNLSYAVILNCNVHMFNKCKNIELPKNVFINNIILNKKTYHGSLLNGIYNNMNYALSHFEFKYFIVASSRSMFGNNMELKDLDRISQIKIEQDNNYNEWWWPNFVNTLE